MVKTSVPGSKQAPDRMLEWHLDSGSQVNICSDRDSFVTLKRQEEAEQLHFLNGTTEPVCEKGSVLIRVMNEYTGRFEDRLLHDVWYTPAAMVNILSLDCIQTKHQFFMSLLRDQQVCFLKKKSFKLKLLKCTACGR